MPRKAQAQGRMAGAPGVEVLAGAAAVAAENCHDHSTERMLVGSILSLNKNREL